MSDEILKIAEDWNDNHRRLKDEKDKLIEDRNTLSRNKTADALANQPTGVWGHIKKAFSKASPFNPQNVEIKKATLAIFEKQKEIKLLAEVTYGAIEGIALKQAEKKPGFSNQYDFCESILPYVNEAHSKAQHALTTCASAVGYEYADASTKGGNYNVISAQRTRDAVTALKSLNGALKNIEGLAQNMTLSPGVTTDLTLSNEFDAMMDVASCSSFDMSSLTAIGKLGKASGEVRSTLQKIEVLQERLSQKARSRGPTAVGMLTQSNPLAESLVSELYPYLSENALGPSSSMKPGR